MAPAAPGERGRGQDAAAWSARPGRPQAAGQRAAVVPAEPSCQETLNCTSAAEGIQPKLPRTGQSSWTSLSGAGSAPLQIPHEARASVRCPRLAAPGMEPQGEQEIPNTHFSLKNSRVPPEPGLRPCRGRGLCPGWVCSAGCWSPRRCTLALHSEPTLPGRPVARGGCSAAAALCSASLHLLSPGVQAALLERQPTPAPSHAATEARAELTGGSRSPGWPWEPVGSHRCPTGCAGRQLPWPPSLCEQSQWGSGNKTKQGQFAGEEIAIPPWKLEPQIHFPPEKGDKSFGREGPGGFLRGQGAVGPGMGLQRGGKCQQEGACRALAGAGRRRLERVLLCPPHFPAPCCLPCHCSSSPGVRHGVQTGRPSSVPPACPSAPAPTPPPCRRCPCPGARARATGSPGTWSRGTLPSCLARHPAAVGNSNWLIPG